MGSRALIAYQRDRQSYDVHYTHWGAHKLSLRDPLADGLEPGDETRVDWRQPTDGSRTLHVEGDPHAERVTIEEFATEWVDYGTHDAAYVVPLIGEVGAYVLLDFALNAEGFDRSDHGAAVAPRWFDGEPLTIAITARFEGWSDVYEDLVESGQLTPEDALNSLNERVFSKWGRSSRPGEVPPWSPWGSTPRQGTVNLSAIMAEHERRITDPNR